MSSETRLLARDVPFRSVAFADERHRRVLALLLERSDPISTSDLASRLAAREEAEVTEQVRQQIWLDLYHRRLPELEAAGWIERRQEGIVTTGRLPLERMDAFPDPDALTFPVWEALAVLLAHPRRRHVGSIIADSERPLTLTELATALMGSERSSWRPDTTESTLLTTLHHIDLPALDEVELIEYDSDGKTIAQRPSLDLLVDRMVAGSDTTDATGPRS